MSERAGQTALRAIVLCAVACAMGCAADTTAGEGRLTKDVRDVTEPVQPPKGGGGSSSEPSAGSGGGEAGNDDPPPPPAGGGGSVGGTAGQASTGGPPDGGKVFDAGSDPGRNDVQAGAVCARLAQIQCAGEAYCCDNPGRTVADCERTMRDGCVNELYLDAITSNPITSFDAGKAAEAFTQLEQLASQCDPAIGGFGASATGLLSMLRGTVAQGQSCSPMGFDKASAAAALASCQNVATTACLPSSALVWNCAPRGGSGASCFSDLNCQEGLHCPNPSVAAGQFGMAQCAPRKAAGAPCMLPNECTSLSCKGGSCETESAQAAYCLLK